MAPPSKESLSIAHVCLSRGWGGLEQYPFRQAPCFLEAGHRLLFVVAPDSASARRAEEEGLERLCLPPWAGGLAGVGRLAAAIRHHGIDVLHCHRSRDLRVAVLASRLAGRGVIFYTDHMGGKRPKKGLIHRFLFRHVARVIALAEWSRAKHLDILPVPAKRCTVVRYGIDLAAFDRRRFPPPSEIGGLREQLGLPRCGHLVGLLARVCPGKGHEVLLQAAAALPRDENLRFLSIGPRIEALGGDEPFARKLYRLHGELGLGERYRFTGYRADVPAVLACLDQLTVPSDFEAFGLSVPESMAMEIPIIATDAGGPRETVVHGETGLHVPPQAPEALASAIARLRSQPSMARSFTEAGFQVSRAYGTEGHVRTMAALYRQALDEARSITSDE